MIFDLRHLARIAFAALALFSALLRASDSTDGYIRRPAVTAASLSEDGRYVVFLTPSKRDYYDVNVFDHTTGETTKLDLAADDVFDYEWIDATRLVISSSNRPAYRFRQQILDIAQRKVIANLTYQGQSFTLVSSLRRDPDLFVVDFDEWDGGSPGLAIINTRLRPSSQMGQNNVRFNVKQWIKVPNGDLVGYIPDDDGEIRGVYIYHNKQLTIHYRAHPDAPWTALPFDTERTTFVAFTPDPDAIYVSNLGDHAVSSSLHLYRIGKNEFGPPLFEDADYSMHSARLLTVRLRNGKSRPLALAYDRDIPVQLPVDKTFAEVLAAVNAKLPGRLNQVVQGDWDLRRFMFRSADGREPPRYLIYDREANSLAALADPAPWIDPADSSLPRPLKYKTRDGLTLEGYLSLPKPNRNGSKPPLIVNPHGGPWIRDHWGYDSEMQFLTSSGYAVFQPNYRGSTGYPRAVSYDAMADFTGMHHDVTDGVKHLIAQGLVDPARIAIYGGSFGGYLAICGAAFEPDLYRCAITFAGVFDWKQMIRQKDRSRGSKFARDYYIAKLGDPAQQKARFNEISPINHVSAIKRPVLVVHGKLDSTVDYEQSTRLLSELKKHKVPHKKLFFDTEFHGFYERSNRQKFLVELEKFLDEHL